MSEHDPIAPVEKGIAAVGICTAAIFLLLLGAIVAFRFGII